jgi:peroxiredoxin
MAATPSTMMPLGTPAPDFCLPDTVSGQMLSLQEIRGKIATVVMFICNHCPYVIHVQHELVALARDYHSHGVGFVAISANDIEAYPQDAPDKMRELAAQWGNPFPYLYDASQDTARAYQAACTPDFFVFDHDLKCAYRGQLDSARPKNTLPVTGQDLRAALSALIRGEAVDPNQIPSIGCNIKWKVH